MRCNCVATMRDTLFRVLPLRVAPFNFLKRGIFILNKETAKKLKDSRRKLSELRDKIEGIVIEDIKKCSCTPCINKESVVFSQTDTPENQTIQRSNTEREENVISALDALDVAIIFLDAALCDL